jgi:hypothetical protein
MAVGRPSGRGSDNRWIRQNRRRRRLPFRPATDRDAEALIRQIIINNTNEPPKIDAAIEDPFCEELSISGQRQRNWKLSEKGRSL